MSKWKGFKNTGNVSTLAALSVYRLSPLNSIGGCSGFRASQSNRFAPYPRPSRNTPGGCSPNRGPYRMLRKWEICAKKGYGGRFASPVPLFRFFSTPLLRVCIFQIKNALPGLLIASKCSQTFGYNQTRIFCIPSQYLLSNCRPLLLIICNIR